MNAKDIDRALTSDRTIVPSPGFATRVMRAVRQHVGDRGALSFPWRRLLPGLIASVAVSAIGVALLPAPQVPQPLVSTLGDPALVQAVNWVAMVLLGSWALVWASMRFAGHRPL
jgi:hypothetical protein